MASGNPDDKASTPSGTLGAILLFAQSVLVLVTSFGLDMTVQQQGAIIGVLSTGGAILLLLNQSRQRAKHELHERVIRSEEYRRGISDHTNGLT